MTWLNKKDTITFFCYAFVSIVVSCFIYPFVDIKGEKIIDFFFNYNRFFNDCCNPNLRIEYT